MKKKLLIEKGKHYTILTFNLGVIDTFRLAKFILLNQCFMIWNDSIKTVRLNNETIERRISGEVVK